MMLWNVPMAIYNQDIKEYCAEGNFIDRIIKAGNDGN
jgi:hypothetical protein